MRRMTITLAVVVLVVTISTIPAPALCKEYVVMISRNINLRTGPSTDRFIIGRAWKGDVFELVDEIGTLPPSQRKKLELLAAQTKQRHAELKKSVSSLQESLDYLRLSIKYLLFDLEATRRENAYLRKLMNDSDKE